MKVRRLPVVLDDGEVKALLKAPNPRTPTGLRNLALMSVMVYGGLRVAEALKLTEHDVDWQDGVVRVRQGKGCKDRTVGLAAPAVAALVRWCERRPIRTGPLFTTLKGAPLSDRYVRQMVKREALAASIAKDVHPHTLRHTAATKHYGQHKDIRLTQEMLGHADISMTQIYTHVHPEKVIASMRALDYA
jgi:integrase/recombinase XerD